MTQPPRHPLQPQIDAMAEAIKPAIMTALQDALKPITPPDDAAEVDYRAFMQALTLVQFHLAMRSFASMCRPDLDLRRAVAGLVDAVFSDHEAELEATRLWCCSTKGGAH